MENDENKVTQLDKILETKIQSEIDSKFVDLREHLNKFCRHLTPHYGFDADAMIKAVKAGMNPKWKEEYIASRKKQEIAGIFKQLESLRYILDSGGN